MVVDEISGGLPWRVAELERDREEDRRVISTLESTVTRHDEQISGAGGLIKAMDRLAQKVDSVNKALYTFAAAFIAAAVTIAVAVSQH